MAFGFKVNNFIMKCVSHYGDSTVIVYLKIPLKKRSESNVNFSFTQQVFTKDKLIRCKYFLM